MALVDQQALSTLEKLGSGIERKHIAVGHGLTQAKSTISGTALRGIARAQKEVTVCKFFEFDGCR
jgi:hypothetical protein